MSQRCLDRVKSQPKKVALFALNIQELQQKVSRDLVQAIQDLKLPGISFHQDHSSFQEALILMQLGEMFIACSRQCATNTVLERLVELPSQRVCQLIAPSRKIPPEAIAFLDNIQDGGVVCFGTLPTLRSRLHRMAETSVLRR